MSFRVKIEAWVGGHCMPGMQWRRVDNLDLPVEKRLRSIICRKVCADP